MRTIDLRTHGEGFPAFMAIQAPIWDETLAQMFTPHSMIWSERIRIFDLRSCGDFWQAEADKRSVTVLALFQELLETHFLEQSRVLSRDLPFRAATSSHPWLAVLLVRLMAHRGTNGCIKGSGPFGTQWTARMPWSVWFDASAQLQPHLARTEKRGTRAVDFRRDLDLMKRSVLRLGFRDLSGLEKVSVAAMKRRFGPVMAQIWRWTHASGPRVKTRSCGGTSGEASAVGYGDFPWLAWKPHAVPTVVRHLDYPHWRWEQLEPLLIHDLDALCRQGAWSNRERLTELSWHVVLEDLEELPVCVAFRHPHGLHQEMGHHKTAVLRIKTRYFDEAMQWAQERTDESVTQEWPVISWKLSVTGRFTYPERNLELFEEFRAHRVNRDQIRTLENQLPIPLLRYTVCRDFLPEDAFVLRGESLPARVPENESLQWRQGVLRRPLFIYRDPKPLKRGKMWRQFLERVQVKWWHGPPCVPLSRDYFRARDAKQRYHWVYRDQAGRWFAHGIYA